MATPKNKRKHDVLHAVRVLTLLAEFAEQGLDFASEDGKEILAEAKAAGAFLEKEIENLFLS